ncbi:MAG: F-type H+-transporting ATPase subunit a [Thermomicrobiales bacterium]|nr:F-type H+-transporting ATPase subunit a [Thermomicrobiales bacterium]
MEVHVELAAEKLFSIGPITFTNSMLMMFIVMGLLLIIFSSIARKAQTVPSRGQGVIELIVEFLLGLVEGTAGRGLGRRIFPLIAGLFIFIAFSNYSGLLPGVGTIGYWHKESTAETANVQTDDHGTEATTGEEAAKEETTTGTEAINVDSEGGDAAHAEEHHKVLVPFLRAPNADLNMTLAMALITFLVVQVVGIQAHGVGGRIKHMASPWWIFPLEVIQEFARIVSLSFRLFGNIFAGEVLLAVMYAMAAAIKIALIPVLFPVVFLFLEVLFGTIQALVFALLTLIYITLAASGHDDHAEEHAHGHEPAHSPTPVPAASAGD